MTTGPAGLSWLGRGEASFFFSSLLEASQRPKGSQRALTLNKQKTEKDKVIIIRIGFRYCAIGRPDLEDCGATARGG